MMRRLMLVPLLGLTLVGCSQVAALTPVGGGPITTVRNAVYDVLVEQDVEILVAPQCETATDGFLCKGTTIDGEVILAEASKIAPYSLTITIGSQVVFTGTAQDVLDKAVQEAS
jgi:hypothetical protein